MPNSKMSTGRNLALMCVGAMIVAFSMFGVTLREKFMQFTNRQPISPSPTSASGIKQGTAPVRPTNPNPDIRRPQPEPQSTTPTPEAHSPDPAGWARMKAYVGKWSGRMVEGEAITIFTFELRENPSVEGGFSGYSETVAMPFAGPAAAAVVNGKAGANPVAMIFAAMTPKAVSWTGEPDKKGITFRVEKRVGKDKCPMTSLTLSPFGTEQLLAEWKTEGCSDGQVLLAKGDR
jgi:hypothetical protein